jgi:YD repeat-containing protein
VVQAVDGVSGETISYQYDVLKRLTQASSTPTSGSTPAAWTQGYTYDGFGNLTGERFDGDSGELGDESADELDGGVVECEGTMRTGICGARRMWRPGAG